MTASSKPISWSSPKKAPTRTDEPAGSALQGIAYASREELCANPKVYKFFAERVETLQQDLAHYEQIKRFVLLPKPFTMESGELTNTLKVRRNVVYQHFADEIDKMYADAEQGR